MEQPSVRDREERRYFEDRNGMQDQDDTSQDGQVEINEGRGRVQANGAAARSRQRHPDMRGTQSYERNGETNGNYYGNADDHLIKDHCLT